MWYQESICPLRVKLKPSSNHNLVVRENMEGRGHTQIEFHALTNESFIASVGHNKIKIR